jgi:hypothetical protein
MQMFLLIKHIQRSKHHNNGYTKTKLNFVSGFFAMPLHIDAWGPQDHPKNHQERILLLKRTEGGESQRW